MSIACVLLSFSSPGHAALSWADRVTNLEMSMFTKADAAAMRAEMKADMARAETKADRMREEMKQDMKTSLVLSLVLPSANLIRSTYMDYQAEQEKLKKLESQRSLKKDLASFFEYFKI